MILGNCGIVMDMELLKLSFPNTGSALELQRSPVSP